MHRVRRRPAARRVVVFLVAALVLGTLPAGPGAIAGRQDFTLVNRTGYQIDNIYVSSVRSESWGADLLGRYEFSNGQHFNISFPHDQHACHWDLMVRYHDGTRAVWRNLDLCEISRIALYWDRRAGVTRAATE